MMINISQNILRSTLDTIENKYLKYCHSDYKKHWVIVRARIFKQLIELQIKEFNHE